MSYTPRRFRAFRNKSGEDAIESPTSGSEHDKKDVRENPPQDRPIDLVNRKITLQLGNTTATFMTDGSWRYSCGKNCL